MKARCQPPTVRGPFTRAGQAAAFRPFMTAVWVRTPAEFHFMIGDDAEVTAWRVGVPPEVDYVEGCS